MRKILEQIRNKTDEQKKFFAFWTATLLTFVIFSFWLFNVITLSKNTNITLIKNENTTEIKNEASAFMSTFNDLKNLLNNEN